VHDSFLAHGIIYLAHEQIKYQPSQCICVRTIASKTQGVLDGCL